eukprot:3649605-Pleurochrysis_carterae.AAC.1
MPPNLNSPVLKGAKGTVPESGTTLRYTASEMLHWAKHSVASLLPVIKDPQLAFWRSWVQHFVNLELLMQYHFTDSNVKQLDHAMVYKHQMVLNLVPQYAGLFKAKHAFAQQYPIDFDRNGTPHHYWCMRFKAFNRIVKRMAVGSNYKNICLRILSIWSMK